MQRAIFILSILLLVASCSKDKMPNTVSGLYSETAPTAGRSQLNFIQNSQVVILERGSINSDTFGYVISSGKISLTPTWTKQYPASDLDFEIIDDRSIKIENYFPQIPEAPKSYIFLSK